MADNDWTPEEVAAIVPDYFDMLTKELSGQKYNKSAHRRNLINLLNNRSHGAIEWKHENISAILIELGLPYIPGYKPADSYQNLLKDEIISYLNYHPELFNLIEDFITKDIRLPAIKDLLNSEVQVPDFEKQFNENQIRYLDNSKPNYYKKEQRNRKLGLLGEKFIISYERKKLRSIGRDSLSQKVEHVSQTQGDSAGFDILSFDNKKNEKFIEVKTTQLGKNSPFYFTRNELGLSKEKSHRYSLYRVFNFQKKPQFYQLKGALDQSCESISTEFMGWPK